MDREKEIEEIIYQKLLHRFDNIYHIKLKLFAKEAAEALLDAGYRKPSEADID